MESSSQPSKAPQKNKKSGSPKNNQGRKGSGGQVSSKLRGFPQDSPEVRISKTLSYILRHGAQKEGIPMREDGYVKVTDLIWLLLQGIVKADAKQRYDLICELNQISDESVWWIKANQGHTMKDVKLELKPVLSVSNIPSGVAVHGTDIKAWEIISTEGLSKMKRNHIHLAQGRDAVSGMRKTSKVIIYIDVQKALDADIKFFLSDNGVVLTEGDERGFLPVRFFSKVEDANGVPLKGWPVTA
ncbi:KptA family-domain-containing protein [Desarmillaria tabescens]|uniref:2'-phosphotransferase n=1 Tax=Armillaria tabescens TaxID=1929756 RepID=A0AA39N575_ARMTA|nr:KptA family-domain-containing protein [Desarmillaria tabescens]KAK0457878.1 KptA family-domain-containing protein [Desarmillaria tabescens]